MAKLGFYFDGTSCVGCKACQIACKDKNRIMVPGNRYRAVESYETGAYPLAFVYHFSGTCNHCEAPACMAACPTGALFVAPDTTVQLDAKSCTGCKQCLAACPYGHPQFFEEAGTAGKCDACIALRNAGRNPVCVDACPMRAIDFGDLDKLEARYAGQGASGATASAKAVTPQGVTTYAALPCWPDGGTAPKLVIKAKDCMGEEGFRHVIL
ncbi:MAG: 4Fe-4S dicluster domain-containing protein [Coriobacteriaceae bacterium]|jgi:anaerobic dimethyl sulfoxide reductase subunit B (iron-sulfur subunit)|nr:4Fe-4S dicluster domain-containing protein [Coriobacteriaceae bacterium]